MLKSGNLMGGAPRPGPLSAPLSATDESMFALAAACFAAGQTGEAFIYYSRLAVGREHPALLYNLALCHFRATVFAEAQKCLEKALALLPAATQQPAPPSAQSATFKALVAQEAKNSAYCSPMSLELVKSPEAARIRVLRLLIDVYAASEQWSEVIRISGSFGSEEYANVTEAVREARRNLGERA